MSEPRPLPRITEENRPFWDAAARSEFRAQRCPSCGRLRALPQGVCPHCLAEGGDWALLSGRGTLSSWCTYCRSFHPAFADAVPYVIAQVDLEEGIRYIAPLAGAEASALKLGMPVHVVFQKVSDSIALPVFELDGGR